MLLFYMVRYLFYTIGDLTYQSPLVLATLSLKVKELQLLHLHAVVTGELSVRRTFAKVWIPFIKTRLCSDWRTSRIEVKQRRICAKLLDKLRKIPLNCKISHVICACIIHLGVLYEEFEMWNVWIQL